jgi:predicted nucleotidyltransferase component of viral defense system
MHPETITKATKSVLAKIAQTDFIHQFYLAGGTALSLERGHRISVDLDFFTDTSFSTTEVKTGLGKLGDLTITTEDQNGTLNGILDEVQVSFFIYKYKNVYPTIMYEGIQLADERDIAAMKLDAISSRGSKKDFYDIYNLLLTYTLNDLIGFFETRFDDVHYNKIHLLKSLAYFEDAEDNPDPILLTKLPWQTVKRDILTATKKYIEQN